MKSFQAWQLMTRSTVYLNLKSVRLFKLRFVYKNWKAYSKRSSIKKIVNGNAIAMAINFHFKCLMTKVLVRLYGQFIVKAKAESFYTKSTLKKLFTEKWLTMTRNRVLMRKVFNRAIEKNSKHLRSRYQRQFDLL